VRCNVCNFENADSARFCSSCGNKFPERRTAGSSERRVVTALFCDVKGSTTFAERLDPEDWHEIIDGAFRVLTPPIDRYGGTVVRLLGDAVLAFFGAPVAHEDDPERALRAGLEMLHATTAYRERLVHERGAEMSGFDIRIGINTGVAVIGDVGSGQAVEYTGMGDAVNVAARLQSMAEPGTMVVSDHTLKLVPPVFEWEPLGALDLRGREGKLTAFAVRGLSAAGSRARPRGLVTPLVGRDRELAALRDALTEVRRGGGRIVSLVGDAGLGKTRLIEEFRKEWEAAPVEGQRWTEARGQSYEQMRSYGLVRQHLLGLAGVTDADTPEAIRAGVTALLPAEKRSDEAALRILDVFLDVAPGGAAPGPEGQELRDRVHGLMRDIAASLAVCQAVFVFDDLQWTDAASADLLMELFDLADQTPVLFLLAFRPDRQAPSWRLKQKLETDYPHRYVELALPPLTAGESAELLEHALPGEALPGALRARVLDRAEGNPFFLEEIVRSLLDDGTVARGPDGWRVTRPDAEVRLPDSLQAVLAARIDRLEAESRETLQAAAVIGRTFLYRILAAIREASDKLDRQLLSLQRLELVREQAREPEREYVFRHALTQEAAYGSILQRKRRELHLRVGEALEALFPERAEEFAAVVGHHYAEAADPRAVRYLKTAGDRALRLHALEEAAMHYRRALGLVRRDAEDAALLTDLHLRYGRAFELRGDYGEALRVYGDLERLAKERSDPAMEGAALSGQLTIFSNPTPFIDPEKAATILERSIRLARERGDRPLLAKLLWNKTQTDLWRGADDAGVAAGRESEAIARDIGDKEQLAFTLNSLGQAFRELARLDDAEAVLKESIALFHEVGNKPLEADSWSTLAFIHLYRGDLASALSSGQEAYGIADSIANDWGRSYALFTPNWVHQEQGDWGEAIDTLTASIEFARSGGFLPGQVASGAELGLLYTIIGAEQRGRDRLEAAVALARERFTDWYAWPVSESARAAVLRGELDLAERLLDEIKDYSRVRGDLYMSIYIALAHGELALARGDAAGAAEIARTRRHIALDRGLTPFEADFDVLEGESARRAGDLSRARAALEHGVALSRRIGSRRLLWRLLGSLAAVEQAEGRAGEAAAAREEAARVVDHIAASLKPKGLDELFRSRPGVREALGRVAVG